MKLMIFLLLALFGIISGLLLIFTRLFVLVVTVQYWSMFPTLKHGDRVIALRKTPKSWLRKGQIVLVWPVPGVPVPVPASYQEPPYIKRIVALSGETYTLAPDEKRGPYIEPDIAMSGKTFVSAPDGQVRPWIASDHPGAWDIPAKHVFVRGDNRESTTDSTIWGPVPFQNILAVVLMKLPEKAELAHVPLAPPSEQFAKNASVIRLRDSE